MMSRIVEPELMDDEEQALAYAQADFSEPNSLFVELLEQHFGADLSGNCLDLGCGPGDICLRMARQYPALTISGIDGARAMIRLAGQALEQSPELAPQVSFLHKRLPRADLPENAYDLITSNSLLHHLHHPQVLWDTLKHVAKPGCDVLIMDLLRPDSVNDAHDLVEAYAQDEPEVLKTDFYHSLLAAFCLDEVNGQLSDAGLGQLQVSRVSDRHLLIHGQLGNDVHDYAEQEKC